jgi:hypothetical protein
VDLIAREQRPAEVAGEPEDSEHGFMTIVRAGIAVALLVANRRAQRHTDPTD